MPRKTKMKTNKKKVDHFSRVDSTIPPYTVVVIIIVVANCPHDTVRVCVCECAHGAQRNTNIIRKPKVKEHSFLPSVSDYYHFLCDSTCCVYVWYVARMCVAHLEDGFCRCQKRRTKNEQKIKWQRRQQLPVASQGNNVNDDVDGAATTFPVWGAQAHKLL